MAKDRRHRNLETDFPQVVARKYKMYCQREGVEPTLEEFVAFLSDCSVIPEKIRAKYMALERYPEALYKTNSRLGACRFLEDTYPIHSNTVLSEVKANPKRFWLKRKK